MKLPNLSFLKKYDASLTYSYAYGAFVTFELIEHRAQDVIVILVDESFTYQEKFFDLKNLCTKHHIPIVIDQNMICNLRNQDISFVIGVFKKTTYELTEGNHIILENITDYGQLGTIIRGMNGFNFKQLILLNCEIDYFHPHVIRASMGSFFHVKIKTYPSIESYKQNFSKQNLFACHPHGKLKLKEVDPTIMPITLWFSNHLPCNEASIQIFQNLDLENNANILFFHFFEK